MMKGMASTAPGLAELLPNSAGMKRLTPALTAASIMFVCLFLPGLPTVETIASCPLKAASSSTSG